MLLIVSFVILYNTNIVLLSNNTTLLGDRIKNIRNELSFSQVQIAEYTGVSRATVASIERNSQRPPIDFLMAFAKVTGKSIDVIVGLDTNDSNKQSTTTDHVSSKMVELLESSTDLELIRSYCLSLIEQNTKLEKENSKANTEIAELKTEMISLLKKLIV